MHRYSTVRTVQYHRRYRTMVLYYSYVPYSSVLFNKTRIAVPVPVQYRKSSTLPVRTVPPQGAREPVRTGTRRYAYLPFPVP